MDCDSQALTQKLIPVKQAIKTLLESAKAVNETETIDLYQALNRILAEDIFSSINVPPADNSAMDGFAVCSKDFQGNGDGFIELPVSQRIAAGQAGVALKRGTASRIFTGAPIPQVADAVFMQEACVQGEHTVKLPDAICSGENVRKAGEDIIKGSCILETGKYLAPQDLGLAASVGIGKLKVYRKIRVAVFFTGDEIREPGETLQPGQIYNSNRYTLCGLLHRLGCDVLDLGNVEDTLQATVTTMKSAASQVDLVMTSGGVSVGEADFIRLALEQLGKLEMWRISMKPGKPLAFGHVDNTPFIGLPGNPVSVFATFLIMAQPFIRRMQGESEVHPKSYQVAAGFNWNQPVTRQEFVRVRRYTDRSGVTSLELYPNQSSGVLTSASWADGFAILREGVTINQGDLLEFIPFEQ